MSELLALGTSHKTAPLPLREKLALLDGGAEALIRELTGHQSIAEAVAISTCNRTELYLVVSDPVEAESHVLGLLARRAAIRPTELMGSMYSLRNCDAARHLYRVTSGLESMIVGEAEVQGQVKRAYERALAARTTGPMTNKLFRAALATGKRVRTETAISVGRASVASVAVDAARDALGDLHERRVVIVGAGETAELTAQALHDQGVSTMFVANRRRERAIALARRFGGASGSFDALPARARARRHRDRLHRVAAHAARRGGDRRGDGRPPRPAAAAHRPRGAARHRRPVRRAGRRDRARHGRAAGHRLPPHAGAPGRGAARRGHRRGGDPGLRGLARPARGAADPVRAARPRRRGRRPPAGRERRPLGEPHRGRPRARRDAGPHRRRAGCCTSRRCA